MLDTCNRDKRIDILKGITICLVVLGHVICTVYDTENYNRNVVFKICYSFHMPLFILISGWLTGQKKEIDNLWIWKRTKRLLIPYFLWTTFLWLYSGQWRKNSLWFSLSVEPLYWYLINIYLSAAIFYLASKVRKMYAVSVCIYVVLCVTYVILGDSNLVIKDLVMFFPFYYLGVLLARNRWKQSVSRGRIIASAIAYSVCMLFYSYKDYAAEVRRIQNMLQIKGGEKLLKAGLLFYNHYIVAVVGIYFIWCLISFIVQKGWGKSFQRIAMFLGLYTMQIYVLHGIFMVHIFNNKLLNSVCSVVTGIGMPLLAGVLIRKKERISRIFFGS